MLVPFRRRNERRNPVQGYSNQKIAEAHGKTPAQIILRWHIQEGFYVIPSASTRDYIKENIRIFDFALTDDEMRQMRSLNKEKRFFNMPLKDKERIYLNT